MDRKQNKGYQRLGEEGEKGSYCLMGRVYVGNHAKIFSTDYGDGYTAL